MRLRDSNKHQDLDELKAFVNLAVELDVRRYLEIGSRNGDSFFAVMANLRPGAFGMSIDIHESLDKAARLTATVDELRAMGHTIVAFAGNSRSAEARYIATKSAPFDMVFIDGDHTYEGIAADWADYRALAPIIALHDVSAPDDWQSDGKPNGVGRFWRELKAQGGFKEIIEYITPSDRPMGYGIGVIMTITDPTNAIEPASIGGMFFDPISNIFYQARGRTAADWVFVPPADFVGSLVKIYDQFYGVPDDDGKNADAGTRSGDAKLVRDTMALSGVDVLGLGGLRWRAASGTDVFMVRLRFRKVDGFMLFAGFAKEARAYAMPEGVGFEMSNGFLRFGGNAREIARDETAILRMEVRTCNDGEQVLVYGYVGDEELGKIYIKGIPSTPVVALFDVGPGPRPVAPGYEHALKRNVERCAHAACYPVNHPFPGGPIHWKCGQCEKILRPATAAEVERIGKNDYRRDEEMEPK